MPGETQILPSTAALAAASTVAPAPKPAGSPRPEPSPAITPHRDRADLENALRQAAAARHADREVAVTLGEDQGSGHVVVRVHDRRTGEVVSQYPPEELLRFFASTREEGSGQVLDIRT